MNRLQIICAKNTGLCYGVKRAIELTEKTIQKSHCNIYTLGPLIHNPQVVKKLEKKGVKVVHDLDKVKTGTIIIRSHGIPLYLWNKIKLKRINVVDATCPFVKRAQEIVRKLKNQGYQVVIVGEAKHPEVQALLSYSQAEGVIVERVKDIDKISSKKVGVVSQTTQSVQRFKSVVRRLRKEVKNIKIYNTICLETSKRQEEAINIAKKVDLMLVLGGHNSANTTRLAQICSRVNRNTYHIETAKELDLKSLKNKKKVGIIGGASTPDWIIEEVIEKLKKYS